MRLIILLLLISQLGFSQNQQMLMKTKVGAAAPFSPTDISGLEIWLDGSDVDGDGVQEGTSESTLTGNQVDDWNDKSTNSFVFSRTGSPQLESVSGTLYKVAGDGDDYFIADDPASSFNFLHQDDITTFLILELDNTSPTIPTAYIIYTTLNSSSSDIGAYLSWRRSSFTGTINEREFLIINANATSNRVMFHGMDASSMTTNNELYILNFSTDIDGIGDDRIVNPEIDNNSVAFGISTTASVSGSPSLSDASYSMNLMRQPSGNYLIGSIAELIIYNRILTSSEVSDVQTYLNNKWSIY